MKRNTSGDIVLFMKLAADKLSKIEYRNKIVYVSYVWAVLAIMLHTYNMDVYAGMFEGDSLLWEITQTIENTVQSIARIAVPGFFFLSGYLFYQNFDLQKLPDKWKSRFRTYVIPYLIWTILPYFFYVFVTHSPLHQYMNMDIVELSVWRMLQSLLTSEFNVLWFLKYLIGYTVCAPLFYLLLKNRKVPVGLVTVIVLIVLQGRGYLGTINIFYVLGCYIGLNHKEILHYHSSIVDRMSLAMLVCCVIGIALVGREDCLSYFGIGIVLFLFWNAANCLPLYKKPAWYVSISFFMYCTHSMILESIEKIFLGVRTGYGLDAIG